jgi:hypothetical protein
VDLGGTILVVVQGGDTSPNGVHPGGQQCRIGMQCWFKKSIVAASNKNHFNQN